MTRTKWEPVQAHQLATGWTVRRTQKGPAFAVTAVYMRVLKGRHRIVVESDVLRLDSDPTAQWWRQVPG